MGIKEETIRNLFRMPPLRYADGRFYFLAEGSAGEEADTIGRVRRFFKRWPRCYRAVTFLLSDLFNEGMSVGDAIARAFPGETRKGKIIINIGSGVQNLGADVVHMDIEPFSPVAVVADAADIPFRDASVDMVISISLLEHCLKPELVIAEMARVVKSGGYVYCTMPFLYPAHGSPQDYTRFTLAGLARRFGEFEPIASGSVAGPATALAIQLAYLAALVSSCGSRRAYGILVQFWMAALAPLRIFDFLLRVFPQREDAAAAIYFFARKRA